MNISQGLGAPRNTGADAASTPGHGNPHPELSLDLLFLLQDLVPQERFLNQALGCTPGGPVRPRVSASRELSPTSLVPA